MERGSTLVPSYVAALGALGAGAATLAVLGLLMVLVWGFTKYEPALRWAKTFIYLGVACVATIGISLGWTLAS